MKFTNRVVEASLREKVDAERIVWDDEIPGLGKVLLIAVSQLGAAWRGEVQP